MMRSSDRWKYLGQATRDTHRYFEEVSTGKIAVADLSGYYPHQTDDGILYLDFSRPIECCDDGHALAITMANGDKGHTPLTSTERTWVLARWPEWCKKGALPLPQGPDTPPVVLTEWERMLLRNLVRSRIHERIVESDSEHVQELERLFNKLREEA